MARSLNKVISEKLLEFLNPYQFPQDGVCLNYNQFSEKPGMQNPVFATLVTESIAIQLQDM